MSLAARTALYFKYSVCAKFRVSPAPSSAREAAFLLRSFQSIAPVDYFHAHGSTYGLGNPFKQVVGVVFSAAEQPSQVDPFSRALPGPAATPAQLEQRQGEVLAYVRQICGIPRYSYVANDALYASGRSMVPFQHRLLGSGHHLLGGYEISPSTQASPFFLVSGRHTAEEVVPHIRHNFQRLHKTEPLVIGTGPAALRAVTGCGLQAEALVNMNHAIDTAALMDLHETLPLVSEKRTEERRKFRGFW